MTTTPMRRVAGTLAGFVIGAIVGGWLGLAGFRLFGSEEELFGDFVATLEGGVVGATAVGTLGCWWAEWRRARSWSRAVAVLGWLLCGVLLLTGIVYIGGWTDADGPSIEAMIGILGIPTSLLGIWGISKYLQRHRAQVIGKEGP
jgi:hypothetical protein